MNPFAVFQKSNIHIVRAKGSYVYDEGGRAYLDMYGGHAVISIGHAHPRYVNALRQQLDRIAFYSNAVENKLQDRLALELGEQSGYPEYSVFFSNSGAEANENAIKMASFHTGRSKVLAMSNAFHGRTSATVAATDIGSMRAPINENFNFVFTPFNDISSLRKQLETEVFCAVIIEGIQGVGGIHVADDVFLNEVRSACDDTGTLLILDEIQSGYGRSGRFFSHQYAGIKPDLITVAKGIANGFPMAATLISPSFKPVLGQLGTTFGGNHLACAGALAVLEVMKDEKLLDNVTVVGDFLREELKKLAEVEEVRGRGLMIGVEFEKDITALRDCLLYQEGVFTGYAGNYTLRLLPALTFSLEQAQIFLEKLKRALRNEG
ncbi:MAG: aminotransferase class III-fold pyridoxal phosphate-dependent enzyme [Sphingobacterium sp.]|jgi:acetylornithine aminotransferase|nr:aminotransferase class III-fold pyridoxal phosphate-dependent enzyme [Sphingobacterium sp.]